MTKEHRSTGLTRIEAVILVALGVFALAILPAACRKSRTVATKTVCANNLSTLGKAILIYANDYDGHLPRAGGRNSEWGWMAWNAPDRYSAYGVSETGEGGKATIGASLYLLVKYMDVSPGTFVCPEDPAASEFTLAQQDDIAPDFTLTDAWDFGRKPGKHYSYAYHMPYSAHALTIERDPQLAVLGDRNPWIMGEPFDRFAPDVKPYNGTAQQARAGNTIAHKRKGQNVLRLDGHVVTFEERPHCGLDNDNIYTISDQPTTGSPLGAPAQLGWAEPANKRDSVLVHEPAPYGVATTRSSGEVDSRDLSETTVIPTLEDPWSEHRNIVWCATLQMVWDRLREDIIGEPIMVIGAEALSNRLNEASFSTENLNEDSYYAAAGPATASFLDEIEQTMARRFLNEELHLPDRRHSTVPGGFVGYAYLGIDAGFQRPFFVNDDPLIFTDSNGKRERVTSFCAHGPGKATEIAEVREQVEILSYQYGDRRENDTFAVDLCKHTQPYQVVLTHVPAQETLGQTLAAVEDSIRAFEDDPNREALHQLRPIDRLIVPDVLFHLIHYVTELKGKALGNARWKGMPILEVLQTIDFSLSRTGVILRSEAYMLAGAANRDRLREEPRHLYFDRPFLIYVKKREPQARPFFVMWVDNAELLQPYQ